LATIFIIAIFMKLLVIQSIACNRSAAQITFIQTKLLKMIIRQEELKDHNAVFKLVANAFKNEQYTDNLVTYQRKNTASNYPLMYPKKTYAYRTEDKRLKKNK
ncbi:MAG: hypothetical protein Q4G18_13165, partial [Myroides sp.]|nr:hypothetical protein [Myroides sp.]